jgi:hypothetical protein
MTENLVNFPKKPDTLFPTSIEESLDHIIAVRTDYCDEVAMDIMDAVNAVMSSYGITVKPEESHIKDYVFLEEAIKAALYRHKRLHHGFHDIIDATISLTPDAMEELEKKKELNI